MPPSSPASNLFFLPCRTIFSTLFKTSKIKPPCAAVRFLPLDQSVINSTLRLRRTQWYLDGFSRYRITKPVYSLRTTIPQGFVIVGTVDVQMTVNCKNSVSLINNLSGKYSMSNLYSARSVTYIHNLRDKGYQILYCDHNFPKRRNVSGLVL